MKIEAIDALVIGAGQAGPLVATRLAGQGHKTVLVEREHLGGTCVNNGCTPTKTLVASARVAHLARRAADFGVAIGGAVTVDMKAVKARMDEVVGTSTRNLRQWLGGTESLELIDGEARFLAAHRVQVGERVFDAKRIFVNTGGRPTLPDWPGASEAGLLTNETILALDTLPRHLVVLGGSYIGLEFAQMYRRFGADVTVVEMGERLIAREDAEVSHAVQSMLEGEGIRFLLGVQEGRLERRGDTTRIAVPGHTLEATHVLAAVGRRPNTDALDLDKAGIASDERGHIRVDDRLQTRVEGVWALGDVNGRGAFTHTSYNDAEIVLANLLDGGDRKVSDRVMAYALYTDPPLARIGLNESQVRNEGRAALVGRLPMQRVARARERSETEGFMKVLVDAKTKHLLGAALFGIEADEVVHVLLEVMMAGQPVSLIERTMHIHPTVSELLPTLLGTLKPLDNAGD